MGSVIMTLELCELGTLGSCIRGWTEAGQQLQIGAVRYVAAQLLGALCFVHRAGLLHRDVKPDNVLVPSYLEGAGPEVALADFGFCCSLRESDELRKRCGTPGYCAPEVFRSGSSLAFDLTKADVQEISRAGRWQEGVQQAKGEGDFKTILSSGGKMPKA